MSVNKDAPHLAAQLLHRRTFSHHGVGLEPSAQLVLQPPHAHRQVAALDRASQRLRQTDLVDGLHQIVVGAGTHRIDRGVDVALGGDDDDGEIAIASA